jgi:hypothetical protein
MATSEAVEASKPEPTRERPRRRLVRGDGQPRYDEEELQRFFTLGPEDVAFVAGTRSDRNRLALALLLTWARAERSSSRTRPGCRGRSSPPSPVSSGSPPRFSLAIAAGPRLAAPT